MRRFLVFALVLSATLPAFGQITRDGYCSAASTSCTLSAVSTGDLKLIWAAVSGSTTAPSLPSGYTSIATGHVGSSSNSEAYRLYCSIAAGGSDIGTGSATSATDIVAIAYKGGASTTTANCASVAIGGKGGTTGTSTSLTYPAITMSKTNASSWVAGFAADHTVETCSPAGMSAWSATAGTGPSAAASDTSGPVSVWTSQSCTITSSSSVSYVVEVIASSLTATSYNNGTGAYTNSVTVTISGPAGATICYTTNGTAPAATTSGTCSTDSTYSSPITITTTGTILKSIATEAGWNNSTETDATYTITTPPPPTVAKLNGVMVGSSTGDISTWDKTTVGTATGDLASWNGLQFSGSSSSTFGTVNVFVPMTGATVGSAVTATNLGSGTHPSGYCDWTADKGLQVSATQGSLGGSVTVSGTTYPSSTATTSISLSDADSSAIDDCSLSTTNSVATVFSYITPGPPLETDNNSKLFDELMLEMTSGDYAVVQLGTGELGPNPNYACAWNIESSPGRVTTHSSYFPIPCGQGMRFAVTLQYNGSNGTAKADFYRPTDWAHLGSLSTTATSGTTIYGFRFGNNEAGTNAGTMTYFEDIMEVSGSSPTYPLISGTPISVPTWGAQNSCSNTGSVTSLGCAITPAASGDGLLIQVCTSATAGSVSVTDSLGQSFTSLAGSTNAGSWRCSLFDILGVGTSADTVTMHNTAGEALIQIVDITGLPTGVDQVSGPSSETSGTSGLFSSGSVTTTHADEVGIGFAVCATNACWAGSGYAQIGLDSNYLGSVVGSWYTATGSNAANFVDASKGSGVVDEAAFITVH